MRSVLSERIYQQRFNSPLYGIRGHFETYPKILHTPIRFDRYQHTLGRRTELLHTQKTQTLPPSLVNSRTTSSIQHDDDALRVHAGSSISDRGCSLLHSTFFQQEERRWRRGRIRIDENRGNSSNNDIINNESTTTIITINNNSGDRCRRRRPHLTHTHTRVKVRRDSSMFGTAFTSPL